MFSLKRTVWSSIIALLLEFYAFNFIPRNINILATRSLERQIFTYILNFLIFFVVTYLAITVIIAIINLFMNPKKK